MGLFQIPFSKKQKHGFRKKGLRKLYNDHIDKDEPCEAPLKNTYFENWAILRQSHYYDNGIFFECV